MKQVLIICDSFPPYGGLRAGSLAKYLPHFAWSPIMLAWRLKNNYVSERNFQGISSLNESSINWVSTPENPAIRCNLSMINRLNLLLKPELSRPEGLLKDLISVAENQIALQNMQAIIATTSGWLPILGTASYLSKKFNIPWIADLRDIDEQWPDRDKAPRRLKIYKLRGIIRRQQLLKNASAIVTISRWHQSYLERKCKRPVELIYNGFDQDYFATEIPSVNRNYFLITYTGALLGKNTRDPNIFFEACRILIERNKNIAHHLRIQFFSPLNNTETLRLLARKFSLEDQLFTHAQIGHMEVPFVLSESAILLLITSRHTKGQMTTKFYEYLASRRPILCVPEDDGSIKDILWETKAGICANSVEDAIRFIEEHYHRWVNTKNNYPEHHGDLSLFSRKNQAGEFAQLLHKVTAQQHLGAFK